MNVFNAAVFFFAVLSVCGCSNKDGTVMTVMGELRAGSLGKTLHHEHILVDFIGADSTGYHRWNRDSVADKVLPYLLEIKKLGYHTLVECTPAYLGRDPELLRILSQKADINILTNTGYYSAVGSKYLPAHAIEETAEELASRWIKEAQNGIEDTGVLPGFIKISVENQSLEPIHKKIVGAAALTHKATGLVIMSHTGNAVPAFQQLEVLEEYGVHPSAFIWTHAQSEKDFARHAEAAGQGVWVAFDGFSAEQAGRYADFAMRMKKHGYLNKLLFSHDAGWYKPGEPGGGDFRGYTDVENYLVPELRKVGLSQQDIYQLFVLNPKEAFKIEQRLF